MTTTSATKRTYIQTADVGAQFEVSVVTINGKSFTARRRWYGESVKRICSKELPLRDTFDEAQADLDAWAEKQKLTLYKTDGA